MNSTVKLVLIVLSVIGLIITSIWYYNSRDLEPLAGIFLTGAALIGLIFTSDDNDRGGNIKMKQKGGSNSNNYQSGRDITFNN